MCDNAGMYPKTYFHAQECIRKLAEKEPPMYSGKSPVYYVKSPTNDEMSHVHDVKAL